MEEVLTCECACQHWIIYGNMVKCANCDREVWLVSVRLLNAEIRRQLEGEG